MTKLFPSTGIAKKFKRALSADDTALSSTITVSASDYGVVYGLWVSLDVASETDLGNLPAVLTISITIGPLVFDPFVHPLIEHTSATPQNFRTVDLGPWSFDFKADGFYSGVKGQDIVVAVGAAGTGIKTLAHYLYSGD